MEGDRFQLIGCIGTGNTSRGLRIQAAADATKVIGGEFSGNTAGQVDDGGTNSTFVKTTGYVNEAQIESASLTLDSTGSKTALIPHGLSKAPTLKQCVPHLIRETAVTDPVFGFLWVETVDATNVGVRARVTTASATGGATFRIGVNIKV